MSDPFFFHAAEALDAQAIASLTGARLRAGDDAERPIDNIAPLETAGRSDLAFLDNPKYAGQLARTRAAVCLVAERYGDRVPKATTALIAKEPYRAFVTVARRLFPEALRPRSAVGGEGVSPGASLHPTARLEQGVTVDAGAVIGAGAEIGTGTVIGAAAVIGAGVRIGRNCAIGPGTTVLHALIGDRVSILPGSHIGQDGFGYLPGPRGHEKVPQVGRVIIQDDVEIGAGTTIDRGANRDTVVGEGTKIDNLVQVGHNVAIGRHCIIVAQTGISGSVTLEDFVVLGARVGVTNHVRIGEGAQLAAISGVNTDIPAGEIWGGAPAVPIQQWRRGVVMLRRLASRRVEPGSSDRQRPGAEAGNERGEQRRDG